MIINQLSIHGEYVTPEAEAFEITSQDVICGSDIGLAGNTTEFEDDSDFNVF